MFCFLEDLLKKKRHHQPNILSYYCFRHVLMPITLEYFSDRVWFVETFWLFHVFVFIVLLNVRVISAERDHCPLELTGLRPRKTFSLIWCIWLCSVLNRSLKCVSIYFILIMSIGIFIFPSKEFNMHTASYVYSWFVLFMDWQCAF